MTNTTPRNIATNRSLKLNSEAKQYLETDKKYIPINKDFTISIWFKSDSLPGEHGEIISQGRSSGPGFYIGYDPDKKIRIGDSWQTSQVEFPSDNNWHNIQIVRQATECKLFIDGKLKDQTDNFQISGEGSNLRIGNQFGSPSLHPNEHWNGLIDEVKIYEEALTESELSAIRNNKPITAKAIFSASFEEGLIAQDEKAGKSIELTEHGSDGSLPQIIQQAYLRGNSIYTIVDGPSWKQAEEFSKQRGGNLLSIEDKSEDIWLSSKFEGSYWLGLEANLPDIAKLNIDINPGDTLTWNWSNGSHSPYRPEDWDDKAIFGSSLPITDDVILYTKTAITIDSNQTATAWQKSSGLFIPNATFTINPNHPGIAEIPFIRRGDSAYVIVEGPTWEEAEANAVALGGHLVTINDAEENEWIIDNYLVPNAKNYFIGATDQNEEGVWTWSSGEGLGYTNWYPGEPNNADGGEDYSVISGTSQDASRFGFWNDTKGLAPELAIVEIPLAPNNAPIGTPTLTGNFKVGQIINIDTSGIEDADNFDGWTPAYEYSWQVSGDNGTTWAELTNTDATDGDDSYTLTSEEVGKQLRGVVSYLDGYGTNEVVESDASLVTPIIRGNSIYTIVDGPSWTQAEANSVKLGGHLISVKNENENRFISHAIKNEASRINLWIGLEDADRDSEWQWTSGEEYIYNNWGFQSQPGAGENRGITPNGTEDYVSLILHGEYGNRLGDWNTLPELTSLLHPDWQAIEGIAEIPFIRRGDSAYVIVEGPTWEEAEANAVALGGHLVTINDEEENEWLSKIFPLGKWIGLNDLEKEGEFVWNSGEKLEYTNWYQGVGQIQPNNYGIYEQDYVWFHPDFGGQWDDQHWHYPPDNGTTGVISLYQSATGIAEIPLAPNNTPTGAPTLTGDFKVGQTISIDSSSIEDADNFEGWTPTFEYAWEVSSDNGTTWSALTTADASDGDDSYTLTTAEVGKQIRGVVSYLDGYGSNEVIESATSPSIESGVEVSMVGSSNVGQYLDLDIQFTDSESLPIRWLGWQAKAPESGIAIKASDITYEVDSINGVINFFYKEEHLIGQNEVETDVWEGTSEPPLPNIDEGTIYLQLNGFSYPLYVDLEPSEEDSKFGFVDDFDVDDYMPLRYGHSSLIVMEDNRSSFDESQYALFIPRKHAYDSGLGTFEFAPEIDLSSEHQFFDLPADSISLDHSLYLEDQLMGFEVRAYAALELEDGRFELIYSDPVEIDGPLSADTANSGEEEDPANHSPQGELLVTGKMEVGQTINLDPGSITDADGIDSDFTYSWQVFGGDTDTWFDRTNPDATDGDASYTLTNDDEGELLRAQVSYVDGNGLTEIISSEPFLVRPTFTVPEIYQAVTTSSDDISYRPGGSIHLPLIYNVSTGDANLSGLTLNVHYDSTLLAPEGASDGVSGMIDAAISTTADLPDVDDLDNDPITDRMVQLVWATFDNSFPDQDLPLQLATVSFASLEDSSVPVDSLTGSPINFTASGTASGYDFLPSTTTLTPRAFDLDVDGDGEVTALGDGLMIIRKLFGPAFAGDKLTAKAISPDATRTTAEIHDFIQDGINAGALDVDQDGDTTALGDGLMVIRRLFGPAFEGEKLIEKAISPDSPFQEQLEPAAWVGYEIDKLNPILPAVVAPQNPIAAPEYGVGIGVDPIAVPLYGVGIGISDPGQLSPTA